ncbi:hypothetical protein [Fluviicola sp.]|uniref:hypothetical protein n=1 Tax=Fluviicola sp. TaxID=1917219 RepID=UPI00263519C6|nr:hypothetical protein [Fluviicola sp.]
MKKVLKIGIYVGVTASLVSCGTSEHFMQDDVYNTRTPVMPPGTDLNDVTDYATFVAKKEQTETPPERTTYVSPRDYRDFFYYSQFMYYGYSPYAMTPGLSYIGYGYPNHYSGFGNGYYASIGFGNYYNYNPYGYNPYGGYYGGGYNPYGYNPYWNAPYYNNYGGGYYGGGYYGGGNYYGGGYTYTQKGKPNTGGNLSNAHAGTSGGRMGSSSNGEIINYPHKMMINPNSGIPAATPYNGVGRNPAIRINDGNISPVVNNGRISTAAPAPMNRATIARPTTSERPSISPTRGDYQRSPNPNMNTNQNSNTRTINNPVNNFPARTNTPVIRSGGGSGGGGVTPSTGGGVRTGGRR